MSDQGRRYILLFLTPFAPGVAHDAPIGSEGRTLQYFGATPAQAVPAILARLERQPGQVAVRADGGGHLVLLSRIPPDEADWRLPGTVQPLAFLTHGLTQAELEAELRRLTAQAAPAKPRRAAA
jgi:hypothetical protein